MKKFFKILAFTTGGLVVLLIVAALALPYLIDVNRYKPQITSAVEKETGRKLTLAGDIKLSILPWLGIEIGQAKLANAPGFGKTPFVVIDKVVARLKLWPLLGGRIEADTLILHGLKLNLAHNKTGVSNWADLAESKEDKRISPKARDKKDDSDLKLRIAGIDVRDGAVHYIDHKSGSRYAIDKLKLTTGEVALAKPIQLDLDFDVTATGLAATRHIALDGFFALDPKKSTLAISNLKLKTGDSTFSGKATVGWARGTYLRFDLGLDQIDLEDYLPSEDAPRSTGSSQAAKDTLIPVPAPFLRTLDMKGKFTLGKLTLFGIKLTNIELPLVARQGVLDAAGIKAALYGGHFAGDIRLDARAKMPKYKLQMNLKGVQLGKLMKDADLIDSFTGTGDVSARLATQGMSVNALLAALDGDGRFALKRGRIEGFDLYKLIQKAKAAYQQNRKQQITARLEGTEQMEYGDMHGTVQIKKGIAFNRDLVMTAPYLDIKGSGAVHLPQQSIDYLIEVKLTEDGKTGTPIPVRIRGRLADPNISVDVGALAKKAVKQEVDKRVRQEKDKVRRRIEDEMRRRMGLPTQ